MVEGYDTIGAGQLLQHIFNLRVIIALDFFIVHKILLLTNMIDVLETVPVELERLLVSPSILYGNALALELEAVGTMARYNVDDGIGGIALKEIQLCLDLVGSVAHCV